MPQLKIDDLDLKAISPTVRDQYIQATKYHQRKYYYIMLFFGCAFFLVGLL